MKRIGMLLLVVLLAFPLSASFADMAADDNAVIAALLAEADAGKTTVDQALAAAIEHGISFEIIVAACQTRGIDLSHIITAAAEAGMSSEVALAKMADAGVQKETLSAAMSQAAGQDNTGLGYTASREGRTRPVRPVTPNPGGRDEGRPVSPGSH